jgi:hypothetical protein
MNQRLLDAVNLAIVVQKRLTTTTERPAASARGFTRNTATQK